MRSIFLLVIIFAWTAAWSKPDVISASNFVPQAIVAKQIVPGTSRPFSFGSSYFSCDKKKDKDTYIDNCETPNSKAKAKTFDVLDFRIDGNLYKITWPRTEHTEGAENWDGHFFGGGLFLSAHYAILLEIGISPILVQWVGPFYVAAAYDLSFGHYFGKDEKDEFETDIHQNLFTGTLNLGGGFMAFMNNHGLGFGAHGGIRQLHILNAGLKGKTNYNFIGNQSTIEEKGSSHIKDWIFYCGFDILTYTNLPLLNESNSKEHQGFSTSIEMGIRTEKNPLIYWSLSLSLIL